MTTYAVTGASGQLGRKVLDAMLERVDASTIVALARDPAKLAEYAAKGIDVRQRDDRRGVDPLEHGIEHLAAELAARAGDGISRHEVISIGFDRLTA